MALGSTDETIDTSAKSLIEHWKWAADKGLMNSNTANALRGASIQVISVLDDWEDVDIATLDIDDVCRRFRNKRNRDFKPDSLDTYQKRFANAVRMFLEYVADPAGWKAPISKDRVTFSAKQTNKPVKNTKPELTAEVENNTEVEFSGKNGSRNANLVDFPFPLRVGVLAVMSLPSDLKMTEVARLHAYLKSLAVDQTETSDA